MKARFTKSQNMPVGARGLLYCSAAGDKHFTVPFIVESQPRHVDDVVTDVWPELWALPFLIRPLGPSFRTENTEAAQRSWLIFKDCSNWTSICPPGGKYVFNPCKIADQGWEEIVRRLGYREGEERE